ncbi:hypothetical protein V1524DRAFT_447164 [Lipomyces starkeyi]
MSRLLVVFGATGQQGGSVANFVVSDPELSKQYKVRGVTRDPSKPAAQTLQQKGVEVVKGDLNDERSIKQALQGAHIAKSREVRQGKAIADEAVAAGAQYFIYSTESHAGKISGGKYLVDAYDAKADLEQDFMQNFGGMLAPRPAGDGTYAIANIHTPEAKFPWLDVVDDTGKFVGAILAEPEKYEGKTMTGTLLWSLPPAAADSVEVVEWSAQLARGKLITFEEYLTNTKNPLKLE